MSFGGGQCGRLAAVFGSCILRLVQRLMEYVTVYAYSFVAIYGMDFKTAGTTCLDMFKVWRSRLASVGGWVVGWVGGWVDVGRRAHLPARVAALNSRSVGGLPS